MRSRGVSAEFPGVGRACFFPDWDVKRVLEAAFVAPITGVFSAVKSLATLAAREYDHAGEKLHRPGEKPIQRSRLPSLPLLAARSWNAISSVWEVRSSAPPFASWGRERLAFWPVLLLSVTICGLAGVGFWMSEGGSAQSGLVAPGLTAGSESGVSSELDGSEMPLEPLRSVVEVSGRVEGSGAAATKHSKVARKKAMRRAERKAAKRSKRARRVGALSQKDVLAAARAQIGTLGACIRASRSRGELQPGRLPMVLEWKIHRNGRAEQARLVGPASTLNGSLSTCVAFTMRKWQFPKGNKTVTVRNFPVTVTVP